MPVNKLQTYADFERQQRALMEQMRKYDLECVSCTTCGSQFFEEVWASKFKVDHNIVLGQEVPRKPGAIPYLVLRCVHCQDILEPRVMTNTRDLAGGDYDEFLDTLEGKRDTRVGQQEEKDEIPSQKL